MGFYGSERQRETLEGKKVEVTEPMRRGQDLEPVIRHMFLDYLMRERIQFAYETPKSFMITHKDAQVISTNDGCFKLCSHYPMSFVQPGKYYPLEIKAPSHQNYSLKAPYLTQLTLEAIALNVDRVLYVAGDDKRFRLSVVQIPHYVKQQVLNSIQLFEDLKSKKITLKTYKSECSKFRRFCFGIAPDLVIYSIFITKEYK